MDETIQKLRKSMTELEEILSTMKVEFGEDRYLIMRDSSGGYLAAPIVTALVNGYAALTSLGDKAYLVTESAKCGRFAPYSGDRCTLPLGHIEMHYSDGAVW